MPISTIRYPQQLALKLHHLVDVHQQTPSAQDLDAP